MSEWFANKPGEVGGKHEKEKEKKKKHLKISKEWRWVQSGKSCLKANKEGKVCNQGGMG